MWIAYDIDFSLIEQQYHIKQFGDFSYTNQIRDKCFIISEGRDQPLANYLQQLLLKRGTFEQHSIAIPSVHHMVPDRIFSLIHPKSFFHPNTKQVIPLTENTP